MDLVSRHNASILSGITQDLWNQSSDMNLDIHQLKDRVFQAAAQVLKNTDIYIEGKKYLSTKNIQQIKQKYHQLSEKIAKKIAVKQRIVAASTNSIMMGISALRERHGTQNLSPVEQKEAFNKLSKDQKETLYADYYQLMACQVSYGQWEKGTIFPGPHPSQSNYKVEDVITNDRGLQIVVLIPTPKNKDNPLEVPIFCCRGTILSNPHHLLDDMKKNIGQYGLKNSKGQIGTALKELSTLYGPAVLTGHSLGGAVAQGIAAEFCDHTNEQHQPLIKVVYHFGSPGVGKKVADQFQQKKEKLAQNEAGVAKAPLVYCYRHKEDIVPLAGGPHIDADYEVEVDPHPQRTYACLSATMKAFHNLMGFVSQAPTKTLINRVKSEQQIDQTKGKNMTLRKLIEGIRRFIGEIYYKRKFIRQIQDQQRMENKNERIKSVVLKLKQWVDNPPAS